MAKKFDGTSTESQYGAVIGELNTPKESEYNAASTQGKKGMKKDRMNMGFTPENYEFLRVMAGIHKMTITKYTNHIIEEERKRNADLYIKARDLMNSI
jgi:hypothetical protein